MGYKISMYMHAMYVSLLAVVFENGIASIAYTYSLSHIRQKLAPDICIYL